MLSLFALHSSHRFVHVSEVERGLACDCRCAICGEVVVARQGDVRGHHFAHASNAEPCESHYESDLHRFAKRVIIEAGGLVVPINPAAANALGLDDTVALSILLACNTVEEEVTVGSIRPDLLAVTTAGVGVAIEIAYSSFCDPVKKQAYEAMNMPALEIDLRAFPPNSFDLAGVKTAILEVTSDKTWLWPTELPARDIEARPHALPKGFLPEEIITVAGRWISVKQLPSGDIAIKVVRYDPDLVSLVRTIAKANHGRYAKPYHSWIVPRFRAPIARERLRATASSI